MKDLHVCTTDFLLLKQLLDEVFVISRIVVFE